MAFQMPKGVMPRTYISPQINDVSHMIDESDHYGKANVSHEINCSGDSLTINFLAGGESDSGSACCNVAERR